ncbi:MAG: insulinase family protein [Opitutaceae bacterium]|nr:insulinase family protein [Opitutaceae bacterium]
MRPLARLVLAPLAFAVAFAATPIPFPHETSDLKMDPKVAFGTLPNGLRYAVRANQEPKQRVALRLLVEAGAVHETDDQQGLAHFLEHLAFNGSKHFAPGTLIEKLQRLGMSFGADTNASTWYTRTLYLLELPDTNETTLDDGLKIFGDYAGGLLLNPEQIEKERGIILSEKRSRDSVGERTRLAVNNFLLAGTVFAQRDVIGPNEVLQKAGRDRFEDFYHTWYRPEKMSVVVVGDIDVPALVKKLTAAFTPLQPLGPARATPDYGTLPAFSGVRAFHHHESEAPTTQVSLTTVTPYTKPTDTSAQRLKTVPRDIAHRILNRRLSILAKQEGAPFSGGRASAYEAYSFYRQSQISLTCRADQWRAALGVADQELRRALEHGFQKSELAEVIANFRNSLEQAVKTAPTRRSSDIADELAESLLERDVWTSPEDDLALYGPALEKITVADCLAGLREAWSPAHRLVLVTGNAQLAPGAAALAEITDAFEKSRALPVTAPAAEAELQWAYTDFGAPGKIAKRERVEDLDITLVTFANGVRLNLKKTDFEANRMILNARIGTGQLTEPKDLPGLAHYASRIFTAGGLGQHSSDDLRRLLAGKNVGTLFGIGDDALSLGGGTTREDLLLQLQLMTAFLTDPGYRPEAARQALKGLEQTYARFEHTAGGPFTLEVAPLLASGDHRFGLPPKDEMMKRSTAEVRAWLAPQLARGAIEIAIVGDLDPEAAIDAVARTFGALPVRDARPALDELRRVAFPREPFAKDYAVATEIQKSEVRVYWPATDSRDIRRTRRLNLLASVLTDRLRLKIREELGDAYSPGAGLSASDVYPGYGYLLAGTTVEPAKAKLVTDTIVQIGQTLVEKGITEDELKRAKEPVLTSLRESARTNGYWLGNVLARAQEKPEVLDWCRHRYADNEAISVEDLNALAKTYLGADRASRVIVAPAAKP